MALVKFEQRAIPIGVDGKIKFCPAIRLDNGDFHPISHQGNILIYDTSEEAQEYFKEDN